MTVTVVGSLNTTHKALPTGFSPSLSITLSLSYIPSLSLSITLAFPARVFPAIHTMTTTLRNQPSRLCMLSEYRAPTSAGGGWLFGMLHTASASLQTSVVRSCSRRSVWILTGTYERACSSVGICIHCALRVLRETETKRPRILLHFSCVRFVWD